MIRDITIGQYYPAPSVLHRLDPRVKFIGTIAFIAALFIVNNYGYIICAAYLAGLIILSKVPFRFMIKGMKIVVVILVITMAINMFLTPGEILWQAGIFHITREGLSMAVSMAIRLFFLILGASLFTLTTTPNQITYGLESLLKPLTLFHVPVAEIAMMMSIALRFIPILLDETDKIMKAQTARGGNLEGKGLIKKIKAMLPVLVPLFVSAFRRANDLAMAMEARCYHGGKGRTQMKPLKYRKTDILAFIIIAAALAVIIAVRVLFGW